MKVICPSQTIARERSGIENDGCNSQLRGAHLNVSFAGLPPYIIHDKDTPGGADIEILESIAKYFGFTFTLLRQPTWLLFNPESKQFEGSIGQVCTLLVLHAYQLSTENGVLIYSACASKNSIS